VKVWRIVLLVAALIACLPFSASADDVVAKVNGVDIKQSDLDFAASEVGAQLANFPPEDRRRMLLQFVMENELMAEAAVQAALDSGPSFEDRLKYISAVRFAMPTMTRACATPFPTKTLRRSTTPRSPV
jgi:peptidyl-prolyl cis-trans isomerase C